MKNFFTLEDIKKAYNQGGFDRQGIARALYREQIKNGEILVFDSAEDYCKYVLAEKQKKQ